MNIHRRTGTRKTVRRTRKSELRTALHRSSAAGSRRATKTRPSRRAGFDRDDAVSLAQAITGSRQQFADAFKAAQSREGAVLEFEALASGITDNTGAYATAFSRAAGLGWLAPLCLECLKRKIVDGSFIAIAAAVSNDSALSRLQRIVDPDRGFSDPNILVDRLPKAVRQVCQIEIDGTPRGTGFLIRSDLVMTAHHVVRELLTEDGTAAIAGSTAKLRVRFGYARSVAAGAVQLSEGVAYRVAERWLVKTSPCTSEEYLDRLPEDPESLAGFWDYAIIQLADVPGPGREGLQVADVPVLRGHRLGILQHPRASPVAWDTSVVRGFLGSGGFRIIHDVNTDEGSSGSPCVNDRFEVVGLHQAGMPDTPPPAARRTTAPRNGARHNRAIPMRRILSEWQLKDAPPSPVAVARQLTADTARIAAHPVFGRSRLQAWVWRSASDHGKGTITDRFLVVFGPKGSGKSFTIDVMRAMLPPAEHSILECRASDFNTMASALEFAAKYLVAPLGGDAGSLPRLVNANTSDNAWLNYQFIGDLLNVLDKARQDRMVWLVLDELDVAVLPDQGQLRKLLDLLYARVDTAPWLRIALLGIQGVPVPGTMPLTERDILGDGTEGALAADVADYMMRRLAAKSIVLPEDYVRGQALNEIQRSIAQLGGGIAHPDLLRTVADGIIRLEGALNLRRR